jgi:hypothetical protein
MNDISKFINIFDPGENDRDWDQSLQGFIFDLAEKWAKRGIRGWTENLTKHSTDLDIDQFMYGLGEDLISLHHLQGNFRGDAGFAVGLAWGQLFPVKDPKVQKMLNQIKGNLKRKKFFLAQ